MLGATFTLSFLVPGLSLLLLPVGYAAGVFLISYAQPIESKPELLRQ